MEYYRKDKNTGLPAKFQLNNGRFQLVGGTEKVNDNIYFFFRFHSWWRIYANDFIPEILWLLQKPIAIISQLKTLILGNISLSFRKYIQFATLDQIAIHYEQTDRKTFGIAIEYTYDLEPAQTEKIVEYLNI